MSRTVPAGTPLHEIAELLATEGLTAVVVTDPDGQPVGIFTERELVPAPNCHRGWLQPVSTADSTNFLCLWCRTCWQLQDGTFVRVEPRWCPGCPEHNFCRFPLIDHSDPGRDLRRFR